MYWCYQLNIAWFILQRSFIWLVVRNHTRVLIVCSIHYSNLSRAWMILCYHITFLIVIYSSYGFLIKFWCYQHTAGRIFLSSLVKEKRMKPVGDFFCAQLTRHSNQVSLFLKICPSLCLYTDRWELTSWYNLIWLVCKWVACLALSSRPDYVTA